jgi:hypothetical protein
MAVAKEELVRHSATCVACNAEDEQSMQEHIDRCKELLEPWKRLSVSDLCNWIRALCL